MSPCRSVLYSLVALSASALAATPDPLEFNRDIRPILSENCFFCHGQDPKNREADLRLDQRESATRDLGGYFAVVPGDPAKSELLTRLRSHDKDEMMPPPKSNRKVSPDQIAKLEQWIREGAKYEAHWAFTPAKRPRLDAAAGKPIDVLVRRKLEGSGLKPSPAAPPEIWLRRAAFDLVGVAPTPREVDEFLADVTTRGEQAYEAATDRLLASPHFGERQAIDWLDIARYADTHGFNNDSARSMWRWRDWVIEAFNANLPYDQFITEQLAGDLLPNPTLDQRIATGFGRNHVINSEGGIIDEEYRVEYVADRVRTTSLAWLGLTMECARCHDHKYDPITQADYYRLFAFFNNVLEHGEDGRVANAVPLLATPTREQSAELAAQQEALSKLEESLHAKRDAWTWNDDEAAAIYELAEQARTRSAAIEPAYTKERTEVAGIAWHAIRLVPASTPEKFDGKFLDFGGKTGATVAMWLNPASDCGGDVPLISNQSYSGSPADAGYGKGHELRLIDGELEFRVSARFPAYGLRVRSEGAQLAPDRWQHVAVSLTGNSAKGARMFVNGREAPTRILYDGLTGGGGTAPYLIGANEESKGARFAGTIDGLTTWNRVLPATELRDVFHRDALPYSAARLTDGSATPIHKRWMADALLTAKDEGFRTALAARDSAWEKHLELRRNLPTTMVMTELAEARPAFVLQRGQYDQHGAPVTAGVPEAFNAPWPEGAPRNRLGLAKWFTQPDHPLTSRVVVNRFWAQFFGVGLVKTVEDFGSQGEWPGNLELLDWLAREFVESGWNVKALLRQIVLSETYRQDSRVTPEQLTRDPENRLLARGPRVRLPAEMIRDHALAISGLLTDRIGGPSVYPYQPKTLYEGLVVGADYPGTKWVESKGDDLFRRSLYTFWKRTVPYPTMTTFDAPDREFCTARRSRTNTPLQALTLMNDPTFVGASGRLAAKVWREVKSNDDERLSTMFRAATGRKATDAEVQVLTSSYQKLHANFEADGAGADAFTKSSTAAEPSDLPPSERAAAAAVASMILNLDETITKF
jgi:hypothetical protein